MLKDNVEGILDEKMVGVTYEALCEMESQVAKWGWQDHPSYKHTDVFGYMETFIKLGIPRLYRPATEVAKNLCDTRLSAEECSWLDILNEEVLEARDEAISGDDEALRKELIQVAAVALSWVMSIDRKANAK